MVLAAGIGIGVMAVRLLVVFDAVLQDIGPVFRTGPSGPLTVHLGKQVIDPFGGAGIAEDEENVGMTGLALVALFVAEAAVQQALELGEGGLDSLMVKAVVKGIVDSHLPFTALNTGQASHNYTLFCENYTELQRTRNPERLVGEEAQRKNYKTTEVGG